MSLLSESFKPRPHNRSLLGDVSPERHNDEQVAADETRDLVAEASGVLGTLIMLAVPALRSDDAQPAMFHLLGMPGSELETATVTNEETPP